MRRPRLTDKVARGLRHISREIEGLLEGIDFEIEQQGDEYSYMSKKDAEDMRRAMVYVGDLAWWHSTKRRQND